MDGRWAHWRMAVWVATRAALLTAILIGMAYAVRLAPVIQHVALQGLHVAAHQLVALFNRVESS